MSKEYRVIEIINEKELIINYGSENGADKGEVVRIFSIGEEIIDPETKESLGTLDIIKDELEIYRTYEKFSVCRKIVRKQSNILNPLSGFEFTKLEYKSIEVDPASITNKEVQSGGDIIVGDKAKIL